MILFSVCEPCNEMTIYDGNRAFGDFDKCPACKGIMDVWTDSGVRNENSRRRLSGAAPLGLNGTGPLAHEHR